MKKILTRIVLCVSLVVLMNNFTSGQIIKLDIIHVELTQKITKKDTLYFPYEIIYGMSIYNDDFNKFHLIFGAYHYYPRGKYKNGVFKVNINDQIIDLQNRREQLDLVLYGDTLHISSELHNKVLLSMTFKKEDLDVFIQSLKDLKLTYHPIIKDYPDIAGTYFLREKYDVIIKNPEIVISGDFVK